jgi:hypothetical protein
MLRLVTRFSVLFFWFLALQSFSETRRVSGVERALIRHTARLITESLPAGSRITYSTLSDAMLKLAAHPDSVEAPLALPEEPSASLLVRAAGLGKKFAEEFAQALQARASKADPSVVQKHLKAALSLYFQSLYWGTTNGGRNISDPNITALGYMGLWTTSMIVSAVASYAGKFSVLRMGAIAATIAGMVAFQVNIFRRDGDTVSTSRRAFLPIPIFTNFFGRRAVRNQVMAQFVGYANTSLYHHGEERDQIEELVEFLKTQNYPERSVWNLFPYKIQDNIQQTVAIFEFLSPGIFAEGLNRFASCEDAL